MYGICCANGPKSRRLFASGESYKFASNNGLMFWFPEEGRFKCADNYCFKSKSEAAAQLSEARGARLKWFLPYDGFSKCMILRQPNKETA